MAGRRSRVPRRVIVAATKSKRPPPAPETVRELVKAAGRYPYVHLDHPLSYALKRMRAKSVDVVPVVSRANIHQMYGIVALKDILATYGVGGEDAVKVS